MAHTKVTKTYSQNTGAANTFSYSGSFDVFKGTEVQVELDNTQLTFTASTINESASPREYTVDTSAKTIHIGGADLSSGTIIIRPVTDMGAPTPRATYAPGSSVTSEDLNNNQTQLMRKAMEYDEQKLSSIGGTMTGHLTMGEDQTIIFEGATDDGYETTLTVTDPTADRTITLPNVTGTVVTTGDTGTVATGMIAADAITGAKIADDALNSEHYTDGSIDAAHLASSSVTTAKINSDAVTGAKIADDAINSEHYTDGSIDTAHIADSQVTSAKIADGTIVAGDLASNAVTTVKITDANVTTAKIAADAITGAKIADDAIDSEHYTDGSIDTAHLSANLITNAKIANDAVDTAHIIDSNVTTAKIADDAITTAKIAGTQVTAAKIASNAVTTAKITDANVTTVKVADSNITLAKLASDLKQTSISDSDTQLPTSGAVVDYVAAQIAPIGGLEVIATDAAFPNTQPSAGVVISIADAGGLVVNGSGTSTTGRTVGSSTVTINNIASNFNSSTVDAGVAMMVSSTGSGQIYNYHKATLKEADLLNLSNDINDFAARYRVNAGEPGSNNDEGDLVYDTSANKMKVYDGSSWGEVTSTGDFKYLVMTNAGTTNAATLNGSTVSFDLKETSTSGSAASVTSAAQLLVSVNGVVQKANTGTSASGLDGFVMADADTITFCAAPASGDDIFIIQIGSAITPVTPADGTVVAAKIGSGAVTTVKIADDAVTAAKIADDTIGQGQLANSSVGTGELVADAVTGAKIADDAVGAEHIEVLDAALQFGDSVKAQFGAGNDLEIYHTGSQSRIENSGTGELRIQADDIQITDKEANDFHIKCVHDGSVELYYDNAKKFDTNNAGVKVHGICYFDDDNSARFGNGDDLQIYHSSNNNYIVANTTGQDIFFKTSVSSAADTSSMTVRSDGSITHPDNIKSKWGTGDDLKLFHNGTDSYIEDSGTGSLILDSNEIKFTKYGSNEVLAKFIGDGAVQLYYDGSKKFQTNNTGIEIFGGTTAVQIDHTGGSAIRMTRNSKYFDLNANYAAQDTYAAFDVSSGMGYKFYIAGGEQIVISSGGTLSGDLNDTSDEKKKKNITSIPDGAITNIKQLRPVTFDWKNPESPNNQSGFIAQEIKTVIPNLVSGEEYDESKGNLGYAINTTGVVAHLTKALQEAITKIETLETKVAALEAK